MDNGFKGKSEKAGNVTNYDRLNVTNGRIDEVDFLRDRGFTIVLAKDKLIPKTKYTEDFTRVKITNMIDNYPVYILIAHSSQTTLWRLSYQILHTI